MAKTKRNFTKNCPIHGEVQVSGARLLHCPTCKAEGKETLFALKNGKAATKPVKTGRTDFPHGKNVNGEKPTLEEVSKIKAMVDQMGLERVRTALRVAEEIA